MSSGLQNSSTAAKTGRSVAAVDAVHLQKEQTRQNKNDSLYADARTAARANEPIMSQPQIDLFALLPKHQRERRERSYTRSPYFHKRSEANNQSKASLERTCEVIFVFDFRFRTVTAADPARAERAYPRSRHSLLCSSNSAKGQWGGALVDRSDDSADA